MQGVRRSFPNFPHSGISLFFTCLILFSVSNCTKPEPAQAPPSSEAPQQAPPITAPQLLSKSEAPETPPPVAPQPLSKLTIKPLTSPLSVGDSQSLTILALDANNHERSDLSITWASENPNIATVNAQGSVSALAPGTATVTAFSQGISASVQVEVEGLIVAKLEILPSVVSLSTGDTQQMALLATDLKNREIKGLPVVWKSKNSAIAKVDKNGLVKAESAGRATIMAKVKNKMVSVQVTVSKRSRAKKEVQPEIASDKTGADTKVEKPPDGSTPVAASKPAEVTQPVAAPKPTNFPNINVEVLDYSWKTGSVWETFNKTECLWTAKVKNNNPEPRHICINYEFLDEENLPVFQTGKCGVVSGNSEGTISSNIIVQSRLVQDVKKSNVVALEAHRLHTFVPAPPAQ
ncbi:MAG: Ig domain-containing protein [Nitrospirae bacterium]|nr:Ig domain-containing protein [Nitrospirota bacterium]